MDTTRKEVMTIEDVANYLRIPRSSVYKLAQKGDLPGRKVGKHWRFHRGTIADWVAGINTLANSPTDIDES